MSESENPRDRVAARGIGPGMGRVALVGAGPGDPGLLTRRGAELLAQADVVVHDHLASARLLDLAPASALRICAGKAVGHLTLTQDEIQRTLVEHALAGRSVVRLKGGDPYIFGRGAEEAEYLRARGIPFEVVPGVTAGVGVSATAGIAVTHRHTASAVAFVTGHADPEAVPVPGRPPLDWNALARFPGTLVFYMGFTRLEAICRALVNRGKPATTPAALVEAGTLPRQRVVLGTLADLPGRALVAGAAPPALIVIGEAVARRESLRWFEERPLFGQRVLVTRPAESGDNAAATLEALGAEVLLAPTVTIGPPADFGPLDDAIGRLGSFDWLVFTSSNGVRHFLDRLESRGLDLRALGHLKLAAIGPTTAEALRSSRLRADLVPPEYRSESLAATLAEHATGTRILLARADRGRTVLRDELDTRAHVEQVAVYTNADAPRLPPDVLERLTEGSIDWITLTSSAIARRLHALVPPEARAWLGARIRVASISPVTTASARELGWEVATEAREYTWDGLVGALVSAVANSKSEGRPD